MLQRVFDKVNIAPGSWCQTTTTWPLILRIESEQITSQSVGHAVGSPTIQAPREETWDEITQEILSEYAEAWERLAAL